MKSLDQICIECGTDKASVHPLIPGHDYAKHYDREFSDMRLDERLKLVEIGVGGGESIRAWLEYFPNAFVFGVDNNHATNPWNTVGAKPDPRYTFVNGDQGCETFWACFRADYGSDWDIVIDDGSHYARDVITTFRCLWPVVSAGGLYCVEDLACSYGGSPFTRDGERRQVEFLKELIDPIHTDRVCNVERITFSRELVIVRKVVDSPTQLGYGVGTVTPTAAVGV